MAEEKRSLLTTALLWMQEMEEAIKPEGLTLEFNAGEYTFFPEFVDRNDKKLARLLTGRVILFPVIILKSWILSVLILIIC